MENSDANPPVSQKGPLRPGRFVGPAACKIITNLASDTPEESTEEHTTVHLVVVEITESGLLLVDGEEIVEGHQSTCTTENQTNRATVTDVKITENRAIIVADVEYDLTAGSEIITLHGIAKMSFTVLSDDRMDYVRAGSLSGVLPSGVEMSQSFEFSATLFHTPPSP